MTASQISILPLTKYILSTNIYIHIHVYNQIFYQHVETCWEIHQRQCIKNRKEKKKNYRHTWSVYK